MGKRKNSTKVAWRLWEYRSRWPCTFEGKWSAANAPERFPPQSPDHRRALSLEPRFAGPREQSSVVISAPQPCRGAGNKSVFRCTVASAHTCHRARVVVSGTAAASNELEGGGWSRGQTSECVYVITPDTVWLGVRRCTPST